MTLTRIFPSASLIWQIHKQVTLWEVDWIKEILSGIQIEEIHDRQVVKDRSIIVITSLDEGKYEAYLEKIKELGYRFGIIHLSDEEGKTDTAFYVNAQFVLRNYWSSRFSTMSHVVVFPLGYKTGFFSNGAREIKKASERQYSWSFAGQLRNRPTRESMIQSMRQIPSHHEHLIHEWNDSNSLPVDQYRALLLDTVFVPCPAGWANMDSFRIYEALECGCIPIVEKDGEYFSRFLGEPPFISIFSWEEVPAILSNISSERIETLRQINFSWWKTYKSTLIDRVTQLIQFNR